MGAWWSARTPYLFKGNSRAPYAGFGVAERAFIGTSPGAPQGLLVDIAGAGGVPVKRDIFSTFGTYISGGPGTAAQVPIGGLTGGLYQVGQLTATALQEFIQQQSYDGGPMTPPTPSGNFRGG